MRDELKELLAASQDESVSTGEFEDLPDGKYQAFIEGVTFKESKAGNLMFEWHFIIDGGSHDGRHHWKYQVLNSAENMKRLTTDLAKFGVDTTSMDAIEAGLVDLLDAPVDITLKTTVAKTGKYAGESFTNTSITAA